MSNEISIKVTTDFKKEEYDNFVYNNPNTSIFKDQLEMDKNGYLVVDNRMQTKIPGVYAAGEVADPHFRQVITSAGMGAAASIQANHFLEENPLSE